MGGKIASVVVWFLAALLGSYLLTPVVSWLARRIGAVDRPHLRKIHQTSVPRMGGLAIAATFFCLLFLASWVDDLLHLNLVRQSQNQLTVRLFFCTMPILALGIVDDVRGLSAIPKLLVQTFAAGLAVYFGFNFTAVAVPFVGGVQLGVLGAFLLVFWIVGVTNAFNLLDGLDGLAGGVGGVAAVTIGSLALLEDKPETALVAAILAGSCFGFLRHNFHPASIFMGDTGSLFLGFVLAVISVEGSHKRTLTLALAVPILVMGIPIVDALVSIFRRTLLGRSPFTADRGHLHHLFLRAGYSQRAIALIFYGVTLTLGIFAALSYAIRGRVIYFIFVGFLVVAALVYRLFGYRLLPLLQRERNWREEARGAVVKIETSASPDDAWTVLTELLKVMEIESARLVRMTADSAADRFKMGSALPESELTLPVRHEGCVVGELRIAGGEGTPSRALLGAAQLLDPIIERFGLYLLGLAPGGVTGPPTRGGGTAAPSAT